jgi:hypothetical protein
MGKRGSVARVRDEHVHYRRAVETKEVRVALG